jgi:hypothetical protein
MPTIGYRLLVVAFALLLAAADQPPQELRRGVNITHWFRFPPDRDPAALGAYVGDAALDELGRTGFTFVRLPVQPDMLTEASALADAVARIQRHGLAVVVALFPTRWHLETDPNDRARLLAAWRALGAMLRPLDQRTIFPEVLNEPVFPGDFANWAMLQHQALAVIRTSLQRSTVILTGADWGGIDGLLSLPPESDPNVIYSFHFYEPAELTALGAFRPGLDAGSMARLPFPALDQMACRATADDAPDPPTRDLMRFYCNGRWDALRIEARIGQAAAWARLHHVAVIAGEFGAAHQLNAAARLAWLAAVREACERRGIGWALWGYDDSMGFALRPPNDRGLDRLVLRVLGLGPSGIRAATASRQPVASRP